MSRRRIVNWLIVLGGSSLVLLIALQVNGASSSHAPMAQALRFVKASPAATRAALPWRTATPSPQKVDAPAGPPGPASDWTLTFSDEFNGSTLDTAKWHTEYGFDTYCTPSNPVPTTTVPYCNRSNNDEREWYADAVPQVNNGSLKIAARKTCLSSNDPDNYPPYNCTSYPYLSGMISTHDRFSQLYGYFEARIKILDGAGFWPAFWLIPQLPPTPNPSIEYFWPPEIDILESRGQEPSMAYMNQHYSGVYPTPGSKANNWSYGGAISGWYSSTSSLTNTFHTYAVDWEPDRLTWYIDGIERFHSTYNLPPGQISLPEYPGNMQIILNLAIGGSFVGHELPPDNLLSTPLEVDYVRVYQKASNRIFLPLILR
ncbi:MAG TPA: glycoside hydrolase family 16 protein [Anaerolineae bacterium]|nr:glycoside hydrolase family 16 protein [Anaerolineae bacterium]